MKKIFVFAAMMLVSVFTFVACDKKGNEPEPVWETPEVLMDTEWNCEGWFTLIFETEDTGKKITKIEIPGTPAYTVEKTFNYEYADGAGSYTTNDNLHQTYTFTIDGGKLLEYDEENNEQEYFRKK